MSAVYEGGVINEELQGARGRWRDLHPLRRDRFLQYRTRMSTIFWLAQTTNPERKRKPSAPT